MKLHDDFVNEIEPAETVDDAVKSLLLGIADRIEACHGNAVKLSDLASVLREDPEKVSKAIVANTEAAKLNPTRSTPYDAPSPAFEKPREGVKQGMVDADDKREQQFPETNETEVERERIAQEQRARDRGQNLVERATV